MMNERIFRFVLAALVLVLAAMWIYFQRRAGAYKNGLAGHGRMQRKNETKPLLILRPLLFIPWYIGLLAWFFVPEWTLWSALPLAMWLRWGGVLLAFFAILLLGSSMRALGKNFVATLGMHPEHSLVTHGPYRWVRHPMYLAFLLLQASLGLIAANWFLGLTGTLGIASVIASRLGPEESQLLARFGDAYRAYMQRTGRFLPRIEKQNNIAAVTSVSANDLTQHGHSFMNRFSRFLRNISLALVLLLTSGALYQSLGTISDARAYPAPGQLVDVGGYQMHIHCVGTGSPTIILDTVSAGTSPYWAWVQPELAQSTRVCTYDRAGWGWSDRGPEPRDAQKMAQELHALLGGAGIAPPYILVGHSLGGLYTRMYIALYPAEVAGLVLVDAAHPEQNQRFSQEVVQDNERFARLTPLFSVLNRIGVSRLYFALGGELDMQDLPEDARAQAKAFWALPRHWDSQWREWLHRPQSDAQVYATGNLGDLPLAVITAGADATPIWLELQAELATLSSNRLHYIFPEATHVSLAFHPKHAKATSQAILEVLAATRTGNALQSVR